ncbi:MAG: helix-turn-helix domain-containing protein [Bacteroidales bacterium]|nr:helix-turn-helix domain-containing protein [Bacteroidales bacterium]
MLKIRKAYKVQLKTNEKNENMLIRYCGSSRFL